MKSLLHHLRACDEAQLHDYALVLLAALVLCLIGVGWV